VSETTLVERLSEALREAWRRRRSLGGASAQKSANVPKAELLFMRARAMARTGEFDMAARLYQDAVELEPRFSEALERHGELLDITGQSSLAHEKYETARRVRAGIRPGPADRHFVLRQRGHFLGEIMAYDAVLKSLKKNTLPYLARGNAYLAAGWPEKALVDYDRAIRLKRNLPEAIALKGEALSMLGRYPEAIQAFDAAHGARPRDADILNGRGIARMALGLVSEANADWQQQFQLLQGNSQAQACVALRLADYAKAAPLLEVAIQKDPDDPYWRLYYLTALRRLGRPAAPTGEFTTSTWPGPLLAYHEGRSTEAELLAQADTDGRRAEALFQLGIVTFDRDPKAAADCWRQVVECAAPSLIEYGAARNELSRLAS